MSTLMFCVCQLNWSVCVVSVLRSMKRWFGGRHRHSHWRPLRFLFPSHRHHCRYQSYTVHPPPMLIFCRNADAAGGFYRPSLCMRGGVSVYVYWSVAKNHGQGDLSFRSRLWCATAATIMAHSCRKPTLSPLNRSLPPGSHVTKLK